MDEKAKNRFVDALSEMGQRLYGDDWKSPLARDMRVSRAALGWVVLRKRDPSRDFVEKSVDFIRRTFGERVEKHRLDMSAIAEAGKAAADVLYDVKEAETP